MFTPIKPVKRKKVNFMISEDILIKFYQWVPVGKRSDFVNEAINEVLKGKAMREASEFMDKFREEHRLKMTDAEIRKARNYGRE